MSTATKQPTETGKTVFGRDGRSAEYLSANERGHFVRPIATFTNWEGEEYDNITDAIEIWPEVFPKPPKQKVSADLLSIQERIADANRSLSDIQRQEAEARRSLLVTIQNLQQYEPLKNLEAVMAGDFAYVVESGRIKTFAEAMVYRDDYDRKDVMRMLTFKPNEGGKLTWHLSNWSDGSGHLREVMLCETIEEARLAATAYVVRSLEQFDFEKSPHIWSGAARNALEQGLELPEEVLQLARIAAHREADQAVAKAKAALSSAEEALSAAIAKAEAGQ